MGKTVPLVVAILLVVQAGLPAFADNDPPPSKSSLDKLIQECQKQENPDKTCVLLGLVQQLQLHSSSEIFTGTGVPSNTLGSNGDLYLDNTSGNYYQKVSNVWTLLGNLKGPAGPRGFNGTNGATGPQGPRGFNGTNGATGATGPQGPRGFNGTNGATGATGATGPQGPRGFNGTNGINGINGTQGPAGPTGATGPQGPRGFNGTNGINGINGINGTNGATGPQGPRGFNGTNGLNGINGINGINGTNGATGPQGPRGFNGTNGATGPAGPTGAQGPAGPQGPPGINGTNGATGPQGPRGFNGTNGTNGINGTNGATGPAGPQGPPGINGTNGATGPQGPRGFNGTNGATGPQGPRGFNGTNGAQGPAGPTGATGPQGPAGSQILTGNVTPLNTLGNNGDFYVNTVTGTYYLKVAGLWVLQASLLQGPQGPPGSQIFTGNGAPSGTLGTNNDFYLDNGTGTYYQKKVSGWAVEGILTGSVSSGVITALQNQINSLNSTATVLKGNVTTLNSQLIFTQLNSAAFGMVSYWKFDGNTIDVSGLGNNGVVTGTTTFIPGKIGQAFNFDGSTYINVANPQSLNFDVNNPFSVSYWIKSNTQSGATVSVITKMNGGTGYFIGHAGFPDARPYVVLVSPSGQQIAALGNTNNNANLFDGDWQHIVVTYDGSNSANGIKFYINGSLSSNAVVATGPITSIANTGNFVVGYTPGYQASYQMDDLRIYNNALSANKASVLFNNHT